DSGLILGVELRCAELSANADARPLADSDIPDGLTVPGDLPVQVRWSRARHDFHHRTISAACSSSCAFVSVDERRIMIASRSPMRTSTSTAPTCFAARITRAMSAWVMLAGRRLMGCRPAGTRTGGGNAAYRRSRHALRQPVGVVPGRLAAFMEPDGAGGVVSRPGPRNKGADRAAAVIAAAA